MEQTMQARRLRWEVAAMVEGSWYLRGEGSATPLCGSKEYQLYDMKPVRT